MTSDKLNADEVEQLAKEQIADLLCPQCNSPLLSLAEISLPEEIADRVSDIAAKGAAGGFISALIGGIVFASPAAAIAGLIIGGGGTAIYVNQDANVSKAGVECNNCGCEFTERIEL